MRILYVTFPSKKEARALVRGLLSARLIACANLIESASIYRWKGNTQVSGMECIALMKTTAGKAKAAKKAILAGHSYKTPCVLELSARPNRAYAKWILAETK